MSPQDRQVSGSALIPPVARKQPKRIEQLGRVRVDDYAWMKDENWQRVLRDPGAIRPDIRAYLEAENAYADGVMAPVAALVETMVGEMRGRLKDDDWSVPKRDGSFTYQSRYAAGAQYPAYFRSPVGGAEVLLLDADQEAKGKPFYKLSDVQHSPDHRLLAFAEDKQGSEVYTIRIRDIATGRELPEPALNAAGNFVFSPDAQFLFWVWRDEDGRAARLYRRPARGTYVDDVLVYQETDSGLFLSVGVSQSRRFIFIHTGNHDTAETWFIPSATPTAAPISIAPKQPGVLYNVEDWGGRFVIRTNDAGAVDFKLVEAAYDHPNKSGWRDLVPYRPGRFITAVLPFAQYLVRLERAEANTGIVILPANGGEEFSIGVDEPAFVLDFDPGFEFETTTLRYTLSTPTQPRRWFDYDLHTRAKTLMKTQEVPAGHDPDQYETRRLFAAAKDGAQIPVTVLMRRDTPLDGSAPLLLYGYGSYGLSMDAGFETRRLSLVDRGWIYAIAHVRGGAEKGWGWFQDGRHRSKKNSFQDFCDVADHLIANSCASAGRIVAMGGSAGGMLMGAVTNMRPDLWGGILALVPFVDVLNTMSDATLPLTPPEWPEWGNPITDAGDYDYIASYSPYDNISAVPYPAVYAKGGLSDPRVTYWEPAKWVAKLRPATTSGKPVVLRTNMEAGHGGAAGRYDSLKETAEAYAFAVLALEA